MANLYFSDTPIDESTTSVLLTGDEAHHAAQVARLREGETIVIADGRGWRASGVAQAVTKTAVEVALSTPVFEPATGLEVTLVQALAKGDRDELAVQASTELGVSRVIPWQAERSISRWVGDKKTRGVARWQTIAREAAKQAVRSRIPVVTEPVAVDGIIEACEREKVLVLDPRANQGIGEWARTNSDITAVALVVGPEGGISDGEVAALVSAGATPVRVGTEIMRTSTAGPATIAALNALLGHW